MNKIKLEIKTPENITIEYNGKSIEINPFIDFSEEVLLINEYIKDYFGEIGEIVIPKTKNHIFEAECRLINYIIQINTNIDMSEVDNNIYVDPVLWSIIEKSIYNYKQFRNKLDSVIYEIKEQEKLDNSLGKVLSDLSEKAEGFIEQIGKISPEDVKELQKTGTDLIKELEQSSVMRNPSDLIAVAEPLLEEGKKKE